MADQLFHKTEYQVQQLVDMTNKGELGLPDLQRGFVWKPNKIRDLLDSMMKGYPIGFVMLWAAQSNTSKGENKVIGKDDKIAYGQDYVIIDGQHLYAVMTGKEISEGGKPIKISFNPITKEFAVWNMSTERNQFSKINSKKVLFIDYKYQNDSNIDDIYISSIDFKVMDDEGNVLDTYPISDDTRNAKAVPIGGKSSATEAFALMTDSKTITILYYDYSSRPLGKLIVNL